MEYYYLDVYLAVNFAMNYLLLRLTGYCRKGVIKKSRLAAGAFLGAVASCAGGFFGTSGIAKVLLILAVAAVMCLAAYGAGRSFGKYYSVLLMLTCSLGGVMYSVQGCVAGAAQERRYYLDALMLTGLTVLFAAVILFLRFRKTEEKKNLIYPVKLMMFGQEIFCRGLLDTGNSLYEPIDGMPVILIQDELLTATLRSGMREHPECVRAVPYSSIGRTEGMMLGAKIEKLMIQTENEEHVTENVVAAASGFAVKKKNYQVILHPDLLP